LGAPAFGRVEAEGVAFEEGQGVEREELEGFGEDELAGGGGGGAGVTVLVEHVDCGARDAVPDAREGFGPCLPDGLLC